MPRGGLRPLCTIDGCNKPHFGCGLCNLHYQRWKATGTTEHQRDKDSTLSVRELLVRVLLSNIVVLETGCWVCTAAEEDKRKNKLGYRRVKVTRGGVVHRVLSHRLSYEHFKGPIPKRILVCHSCDFPPCCNPEHLFPGTHSENTQDMVSKHRGLVGELNRNSKLTEDDVRQIFQYEKEGLTRVAISRIFEVNPETISHILTGRNWGHLHKRRKTSSPARTYSYSRNEN
jgi:hypothetical protein